MSVEEEESGGGGLVRPKDAAISCSHLWAYLLLVSGLAGFVMGAILFSGELGRFMSSRNQTRVMLKRPFDSSSTPSVL